MKIFVTGASGYIGGSVAHKLLSDGHHVVGLVRDEEQAALAKQRGMEPVIGSFADTDLMRELAAQADGVVHAASADNREIVEVLVSALEQSGKPFIHTSGSSIVCDDARGDSLNPVVYTEDTYFEPQPYRVNRVEMNRFVREAGISRGIRSIVICPGMVYGQGLGMQPDSDQIPKLTALSQQAGAGLHVGQGVNRYSNVYIKDLVELFALALAKAPAASFFYAENGEASFKDIAVSISRSLGFDGRTRSLDADEVIRQFGDEALYGIASNSRVSAVNARRTLNWQPSGPSLAEVVENKTEI